MSPTTIRDNTTLTRSNTWAHQIKLPKLPIPPLEDTCQRYLTALKGLQDEQEHEKTKRVVESFLHGDGPRAQEMLNEYAKNKDSYIEEFWYCRHESAYIVAT
jgi:carnitine O-acetyltransferase